jgi:hypothetical protein
MRNKMSDVIVSTQTSHSKYRLSLHRHFLFRMRNEPQLTIDARCSAYSPIDIGKPLVFANARF